jgi:hypothetical protein
MRWFVLLSKCDGLLQIKLCERTTDGADFSDCIRMIESCAIRCYKSNQSCRKKQRFFNRRNKWQLSLDLAGIVV